jgi:hypothetical protein
MNRDQWNAKRGRQGQAPVAPEPAESGDAAGRSRSFSCHERASQVLDGRLFRVAIASLKQSH